MQGWLFPPTESGLLAFCVLTGLGVLAALATGRSFAASWSPLWLIVPAMIALAAAVHFLHYALFQENLTSVYYYSVTFLILLIFAALGYRAKRALQMGTQYRWMFYTEGMFWSERRQ
jgi:Domain of unknown function (DUF6867)